MNIHHNREQEQNMNGNSREERAIRAELKEQALRHIAEQRWSFNDLLTVFGMALKHKFTEIPDRHQLPGKHTLKRRDRAAHPAGTKLVRGFIRRSGRESTQWRNLYKDLTGAHYGQTEPSS